MTATPRLGLPLVEAGQAQKHVTHNEALMRLDRLVHAVVLDRDLAAPPGAPAAGASWIVAAGASGAWTGAEGRIATWTGSVWDLTVAGEGHVVWVADEDRLCVWTGAAWQDVVVAVVNGEGGLQNLTRLGVGTTADAGNPLAAKLNGALFTALRTGEGGTGDLYLTLEKATAADTLSLLFQTGYSGRAEIGLVGSNDLAFKTSADGAVFTEALRLSAGRAFVAAGTAAGPGVALIGQTGTGLFGPGSNSLALATAGTERLRVDAAGLLHVGGIGTGRLNLEGASEIDTAIHLRNTTAGVTARLFVTNDGRLGFGQAAGSTLMSLQASTGRVGMGTDSPTSRLHLEGASTADNALTIRHSTGTRASVIYNDASDYCHFGAATAAGVGRWQIDLVNGHFRPGTDNAHTIGTSSRRPQTIYAVNGTINTSDRRDKEPDGGIGADTAWSLIGAIEPTFFRWLVGGNDVALVEEGEEMVDEPVVETVLVEEETVTVEDGRAVLSRATVERRRAVLDRVPLVDPQGRPVTDAEGHPRMVEIPRRQRVARPRLVERAVPRPGERRHAGFFAQDVKAALDAAGLDFGVWGLDDRADPESRQWLRPDQLVPILWAALRDVKARLARLEAS